jgi:hypothetical protein
MEVLHNISLAPSLLRVISREVVSINLKVSSVPYVSPTTHTAPFSSHQTDHLRTHNETDREYIDKQKAQTDHPSSKSKPVQMPSQSPPQNTLSQASTNTAATPSQSPAPVTNTTPPPGKTNITHQASHRAKKKEPRRAMYIKPKKKTLIHSHNASHNCTHTAPPTPPPSTSLVNAPHSSPPPSSSPASALLTRHHVRGPVPLQALGAVHIPPQHQLGVFIHRLLVFIKAFQQYQTRLVRA